MPHLLLIDNEVCVEFYLTFRIDLEIVRFWPGLVNSCDYSSSGINIDLLHDVSILK